MGVNSRSPREGGVLRGSLWPEGGRSSLLDPLGEKHPANGHGWPRRWSPSLWEARRWRTALGGSGAHRPQGGLGPALAMSSSWVWVTGQLQHGSAPISPQTRAPYRPWGEAGRVSLYLLAKCSQHKGERGRRQTECMGSTARDDEDGG